MTPEQMAAAYGVTEQTLDDLLAEIAPRLGGTDYASAVEAIAAQLGTGRPENLARLLAAALLRVLAAGERRNRAAEEIARLNAQLDIALAKTTGVTQ